MDMVNPAARTYPRRPPSVAMKLDRMGAAFPTRLSFMRSLVRRMARELRVVGADVVEVSPPYDQSEITAYLGNRVVLEILNGMAERKLANR